MYELIKFFFIFFLPDYKIFNKNLLTLQLEIFSD